MPNLYDLGRVKARPRPRPRNLDEMPISSGVVVPPIGAATRAIVPIARALLGRLSGSKNVAGPRSAIVERPYSGPVKSPWTPEQFLREAARLERARSRVPRSNDRLRRSFTERILRERRLADYVEKTGNLPPGNITAPRGIGRLFDLSRGEGTWFQGVLGAFPIEDYARAQAAARARRTHRASHWRR